MQVRNKKRIFILVLFGLLVFFLSKTCSFNNKNGYTGRLLPLQSEIDSIENYKKAVNMIINNLGKVREDVSKYNSIDSLLNYLADTITDVQLDFPKLRFIAYPVKIEGKDTVIEFKARAGDYYMVSNKANELLEIPPYSLYRHNIVYSTKPIELTEKITKIEDNYYYVINEYDEY